jgi:hypothetical protein
LLGQCEFTPGEITPGLREEDRDLDRKDEIAIDVLMQTVEIAGAILQQQRRRSGLGGIMAEAEEIGMRRRVALSDP